MAEWLTGGNRKVLTALQDWLAMHGAHVDLEAVQAWAGGAGESTDATIEVVVPRLASDSILGP